MRPFFARKTIMGYPIFATIGASFGYWLQGVDERQTAILQERKAAIMEKRARRAAQKEGASAAVTPVTEGAAVMA